MSMADEDNMVIDEIVFRVNHVDTEDDSENSWKETTTIHVEFTGDLKRKDLMITTQK